ncbi:MAG TPA: DNA adenine methylase [Syntrophomonadaceae bacterium]|nr:DNA adenine methylase [Syntrophomonadaceae bacterium]
MQILASNKGQQNVRPFIKWAGGKSQLLTTYRALYPPELKKGEISTFIEPMVGGGAVLLDVLQNYDIENAIICDINKVLINTYLCVKHEIDNLIKALESIQSHYLSLDSQERKTAYYKIRDRYNLINLNDDIDLKKAVEFIFLNKTCFNGLYRVNAKGEFNVPIGSYKNPKIYDETNLRNISKLLQNTKIYQGDYKTCMNYINNSTFVYLDPPYRPLNSTSNFTAYNSQDFNELEQEKLASFFQELDKLGAKAMLSNSDPKNTDEDDNFFDNLYEKYNIHRVQARRMINSKGSARGNITEIVVTNY